MVWIYDAALVAVAVVGLSALALWGKAQDREEQRYTRARLAADSRYLERAADAGPDALAQAVADITRSNWPEET
jgi:hypothetical protein